MLCSNGPVLVLNSLYNTIRRHFIHGTDRNRRFSYTLGGGQVARYRTYAAHEHHGSAGSLS